MSEHHKGKECRKRRGQEQTAEKDMHLWNFYCPALIGIRNLQTTKCQKLNVMEYFTEESLNVRYPSVCFQKSGTNGPSRNMDTMSTFPNLGKACKSCGMRNPSTDMCKSTNGIINQFEVKGLPWRKSFRSLQNEGFLYKVTGIIYNYGNCINI